MTRSSPPKAAPEPHIVELHGEKLQDDYAWLRRRDAPETLAYLEAENAFTEATTAATRELQDVLYAEMKARLQEDDVSVPVQVDDYLYYSRTEKGRQYPIHCRRRDEPEAAEQVLLDLNAMAGDGGYLSLGVFQVSPDHRLLAYSLDLDGSERFQLRVKDLDTGEDLPERIENTSESAEWLNDGKTLVYGVRDAALRPYRAYAHRLGEDPAEDRLLFEEADERFFLSLKKSRSRRWIFLRLGTHSTTELHVLDADDPEGSFRMLAERTPDIEFSADHHGDRFLLLTNLGAADFRLLEVPVDDFRPERRREVLAERPEIVLERLACFRDHLVLEVRRNGLRGLEIRSLGPDAPALGEQEPREVPFDEPVYTVHLGANPNFDTSTVRFELSSFTTPRSVYDLDMVDGSRELRKRDEVDGFEAELYESERLFVEAEDGARIPVSLVRRKDVADDPRSPLLLYGYGSYGASIEPRFSITRVSLLDRGITYAVAHVRGGGAFGRRWYEAGKLKAKEKTFSDFETVADTLISKGHTTPRGLMIRGASAGGLLVGATLNRRPELYHAALAEVPFVDALNTMLDPTIPLTVIEYGEWGNPTDDPEAFRTIRRYSPYENLRPGAYPHLLVTAGLNDPRVQYWEPAKWVAKLRAGKQDDNLLLLKTDMGSGHGGASGRYDALKQEAFKSAFLLHALDLDRI